MIERIDDQALRVVLEDRIAHLSRMRLWYETTIPWLRAILSDFEKRDRAELAALLRLQRKAQKLAAKMPDPIDQALSYHDWQAAGPVA